MTDTVLTRYATLRATLPTRATHDDVLDCLHRSGAPDRLILRDVDTAAPDAHIRLGPDGPALAIADPRVSPADAQILGALVSADLEMVRLREHSRHSLRQSQRVARQLHQIVTAALNATSATTATGVLTAVARAARGVFDAETVHAVVVSGPSAPLAIAVSRGQLPVRIDPTMVAPLAGETSLVGAFGNDVATVEGHLAISLGRNPTDDDRELLRLLTSLATSTLASLALMVSVREADVRLRQLVDATPVALIESTIEEDVVWSNPTAQSLLHWSSEQGTWPPALLEALRPLWANASDHTAAVELPPLDINGQSRLLNASVAALPDSPRVLTVLDDLTDQRALRDEVRLAQGLGIKGEVASAIAHDFNNLLTLVSGYCELLTPQLGDDQTARDLVGSIAATVVRAATLTAQLQSIGRPTTPDFTALDINNAVRATADVLERVVGNDVTMTLSLEAAPATTRTNPDLFEQMLVNLAVNARDAMAGVGSLLIATDLETEDARGEGTYVRLRVSDSGCGMDETTLAKCFDPLFTTKGPLKGTGMGLAGVRRLVEESHGTVAVASVPGAGTTFTFRFPLVHVEPPVTPRREARRSATIAVVDDDDAVRQLMVQVLRRSGYEVLAFSSGVDALECPLLDQLDLLVSDVVMPELSGPELARRLMVSHPALPILLVSGTATPASLDGLSPLVTLLSKPFRPSLFMDEVNARLSERR